MKPESGNRSNQQPEEGDKDQRDMPAKDRRVLKRAFFMSVLPESASHKV